MLRGGQVSSVDLVEGYLGRIKANTRLRAFITVDGEAATREARAAGRRVARNVPGPLLGVPLAIKDLFATGRLRTTVGSRILRDWVPESDAAAVGRLRAAGAVVLGKTNLHEFAYGVTNGNPWWGVAKNPWDPERIPGGSSGGSAIAVVSGLAAGALGSDTGGSIRIPAALCGCVGLKPTFGVIPLDGAFPLGWSLDHAGPLTRTVDDARLLFEILAADPDAELTVDLAEQGVLLPDGSTIDFEIDSFAKRMILAGTDELGYLLSKEPELDAWEAAHPPRIDSLAGAS